MSLQSIRAKVISRTLTSISNAAELTYLNRLINDAVEDIYRVNDLVGSIQEQIIYWADLDSKMLSLPHYILEIRGLRWYEGGSQIVMQTPHARYQTNGYGQSSLNWREVGQSALSRQITNASTLTFTLPLAETVAVVITVIGQTPNSTRLAEEVTIPAGSLSVDTVNDFVLVKTISKEDTNTYDIAITDADGVSLGSIPNTELKSQYKVIQVNDDRLLNPTQLSGVEILFKRRLTPLVEDLDEVLDGRYDEAIYWKCISNWYSTQDDKAQEAILSLQQAKAIMEQVATEYGATKEQNLQFDYNKCYGLFDVGWTGRVSRQIPAS